MINLLKKYLKLFFNKLNFIIISKNYFDRILLQRNKLFYEALNHKRSLTLKDKTRISCIVFSRDRGFQLFALLESMIQQIQNINKIDIYVLYSVSTEKHNTVYDELIDKNLHLNLKYFKHSGNNKEILSYILSNIRTEKLFFLCDDDIFINILNINEILKIDSEKYVLSLRHHINLKYCNLNHKFLVTPKFKKFNDKLYSYLWNNDETEWGDIMSVNGQIYNTDEISLLTSVCTFSAPNSYELELKILKSVFINKFGLCFESPSIINLPFNQVQNETNVVHGNIDADYLLEKWVDGFKLDLNILNGISNDSFYQNINIKFKNR